MTRLTATLGLVATSAFALLVPTAAAGARVSGSLQTVETASVVTLTHAGETGTEPLRIAPGVEQRGVFTLVNSGNDTYVGATFGVSLDGFPNGDSALKSTSGNEMGRWLSLGVTLADIAPASSMAIPYTISVPSEATAANATWTVIVRHDGTELARADLSAEVVGPSRSAVRVASVSAERSAGKPVIAVMLHNDGNIPADVSGSVAVDALKLTQQFTTTVAAQNDALVTVSWAPNASQAVYEVAVAAKTGSDSVAWSGRIASTPITASGAPGAENAGSGKSTSRAADDGDTVVATSSDHRFDPLTVAVIVAIVLAFLWLILEVAASRRGAHGRAPVAQTNGSATPTSAQFELLASQSLSEQLAPLVAAIQQLANSMQPQTPVDAADDGPAALFELVAAECEVATPTVMAGDAVGEETMNESASYFTDEEYVNVPGVVPRPTPPTPPATPAPANAPANVTANAPAKAPVSSSASERIANITAATDAVVARISPTEAADAIAAPEATSARSDQRDAARRLNEHAERTQAARAELINEVAVNLNIPKAVLMEWIPDALLAKVGVTDSADTSEAAAMRRENQVLQLEVAILKRAVSHFARS